MLISEIFKSIQGEGKYQGRQATFIRFPGCNLCCSNCDSKYSWEKPIDQFDIPFKEIIKQCVNSNSIVFTGGEPLLPNNLKSIKKIIKELYYLPIEIETNGTIELNNKDLDFLCYEPNKLMFNISPKFNFPQDKIVKIEPKLIHQLNNLDLMYNIDYIIKFLFNDIKDLQNIEQKIEEYKIDNKEVYVQPIGINSKILKSKINKYWEYIMAHGWNISLRSHVFLFENMKGV